MRVYTAHTLPRHAPVLVREGFAWGAFVFGPLWLLGRRAWIAGALGLCAWVAIGLLLPAEFAAAAVLALHWVLGVFGHDLHRWSLGQDGYLLAHVVAAPDADAALARLLHRRPDLIPEALA